MTRLEPDYDLKINDVSIKANSVVEKITVALPVNSQASSFTVTLENGAGTYNNFFAYHDDVKIYLGYVSEGTTGVFHGRVEKVKRGYNSSTGATVTISGRGAWVLLMEYFTIATYSSTDLGTIIETEVDAHVPGLTTTNVATAGIAPPEEFLDHTFLNQMVSDYCTKAQYFAWVDFDDDLHFTGSPGANSVSIDSGDGGNVEDISFDIDWKTVRNYIRVYGKSIEDVQLLKTEQDSASIAKYGTVMKIIKNGGMDTVSLVQSIADASLLEDKESEWGGIALIYGDERIEPGKTITINVPEIGESATSYRVRHVNHTYEPGGAGFKTTVMLVEDEEDTSNYYKELFEKTKESIAYSNAGNYEESYVYKFTNDQDSLLTFVNTYTNNSTLFLTNQVIEGTCILTTAIVGDANYTYALPYISQEFAGNTGNKYYLSNDGGATWEQVYHDTQHTFASASGDKNDFKFKISMNQFDVMQVSSVTADTIYGLDGDGIEQWNFAVPDNTEEIWGLGYDVLTSKLYETENSTGKIYEVDPTDGSSEVEKADLAIELGGCTFFDSNLWVIDRTNNTVSKRNSSNFANEDYYIPGPAANCVGITNDGTDLYVSNIGADFSDGFEDGNYTSNPSWYRYVGNDYPTVQSVVKKSGTYAFEYAPSAGQNLGMETLRRGTSSEYSTWIYMTDVSDTIAVEYRLNDESGSLICYLELDSGGFKDHTGTIWATGLSDNTWYKVKIVYDDWSTHFDAYLYNAAESVISSSLGRDVLNDGIVYEIQLYCFVGTAPGSKVYFDEVGYGGSDDGISVIEEGTVYEFAQTGGSSSRTVSNTSWYSQAFKVDGEGFALMRIYFSSFAKTGTPNADFLVSVYEADSDLKPTGSPLTVCTIQEDEVAATAFDFATIIGLDPTKFYCMVCSSTCTSGSYTIYLSSETTSFSNFKQSTDQGSSWGGNIVNRRLRISLQGYGLTNFYTLPLSPYDLAHDSNNIRYVGSDDDIYEITGHEERTDGFEDGDYTADPAWDNTSGAGSASVQSAVVKTGNYALSMIGPYFLQTTRVDKNTTTYTCWIRSEDAGEDHRFELFGNDTKAIICAIEMDDKYGYAAFYARNAATSTRIGTEIAADNTWYKLKITYVDDASTYAAEVFDENEISLGSLTGLTTISSNQEEIGSIRIGSAATGTTFYYDDVTYGSQVTTSSITPPGGGIRGLTYVDNFGWSKVYTFGVYLK